MPGKSRGINRRIPIELTPNLVRRFWSGVDKAKANQCWNWMRSFRNGYGAIKHKGQVLSTHRVAYVIANGEPKNGLLVTHTCDNRACCNPKHLEAATPQKNNQDAHDRGEPRHRGEMCHTAKLDEATVAKIWSLRRTGLGASLISRKLGINRSTTSHVIEGQSWKHLIPNWAK